MQVPYVLSQYVHDRTSITYDSVLHRSARVLYKTVHSKLNAVMKYKQTDNASKSVSKMLRISPCSSCTRFRTTAIRGTRAEDLNVEAKFLTAYQTIAMRRITKYLKVHTANV